MVLTNIGQVNTHIRILVTRAIERQCWFCLKTHGSVWQGLEAYYCEYCFAGEEETGSLGVLPLRPPHTPVSLDASS